MALIVFLRGVNVGGRKTFRPAALAKALAKFDVVNIGAAGTFVVRRAVGQAALRAAVLRRLPFEAEVMICPARDVVAKILRGPFGRGEPKGGVKAFVTIMAKAPRAIPRLPFDRPEGRPWEVRVVGINGRYAFSLWRRQAGGILYPNEVVEKGFDISGTTRNWNTILAIRDALEAPGSN